MNEIKKPTQMIEATCGRKEITNGIIWDCFADSVSMCYIYVLITFLFV